MALKPVYQRKEINKEEYKEIMRRAVPKVRVFCSWQGLDKMMGVRVTRSLISCFVSLIQICHHRSGEINPSKIQRLVQKYIQQVKHERKKGNRANK